MKEEHLEIIRNVMDCVALLIVQIGNSDYKDSIGHEIKLNSEYINLIKSIETLIEYEENR